MLPLPAWAGKAIAGVLLAAGLAAGALAYRSHVYDEGYAAGQGVEQQKHAAELAFARATDQLISDEAEAALRSQLKDETNAHKARTTALEAALAAARADGVRLSQRLAGLHNDAVAGRNPGSPGATPGPGPEGDPAAGDGADAGQFTLADLMRNDESNYTICRKNSARLTAIQDWYEALRAGDLRRQRQAVESAPED
ncbi:hypothetical protein [Burkholderia oklahomensis]|uniref:Uncharacterized protein n=1 Tax=Burkholderia oklahomensis TaxID=342113 RepID=A0AAI8FPU0_9BURK|nr:hypothetical protein [Burkholderia oklahomensis]AIO68986.1 hypothetical protein DM82_4353 [Burkholderia oklahomensis]AOI40104.1 hypothetical protein WG70_11110 [Burkholderia oklahomensis EO147]KUY68338.1 hypothetical protein WG70_25050 [Burkholderia oklahomensis EO147]QPS39526.1 hypothetical protein I6G57_27185 [Burkholderia oklahomensis]